MSVVNTFKIGILLFLLVCNQYGFAQKIITNNNQQWFQYYNEAQVSKNIFINTDGGIRFRDGFSQLSTVLLRTGVGYKIYEDIRGSSGIALFTTLSKGSFSRIEIRPYQDFLIQKDYPKFSMRNRFRVEARYFRNLEVDSGAATENFNFRFRYSLNFQIPLITLSKTHLDRKLLLNIGDEIFINAGKQIVNNVFDNNRLILGLTYQENPNLKINLLYNYQFGQRSQPSTFEQSQIVWITVTHRILKKN